jgi:hypothetical protein
VLIKFSANHLRPIYGLQLYGDQHTSTPAHHYYTQFLLYIRHLQAQYTQLQKYHYKDCLQAHNKRFMTLNIKAGFVGVIER